ncbi:MAG: sugar ABC transporter permease [Chloroflexi bacterium HGW-Chloroflexi-10]|nr:MAG: sugar ABC transporter permease [Chloroflexi bacterium HGW-Chloroflexi-10]
MKGENARLMEINMNLSLKMQRKIIPYLFLVPGLLFFIVFQIYPLLQGFQMSFYNWSIMPGKPSIFIGLDNFARMIKDPVVLIAVKNTLLYALITVPGQMILAMMAAVVLHNLTRGKGFFRVLYYIPVITSWVIVSLLIRYLFSSPQGLVNYYLVEVFHLVAKPIPWLIQAKYAMVPIWFLGIWKGIGWSMVIYMAALNGIPLHLYEAAAIDGANAWQKFMKITLPLVRPTTVFTLVVLLIGGFNVFISVYLITGGGPAQQTEVLLSYAYHQAFDFLKFGYGAAVSMAMAVFLVFISYLQMRFLRNPQEMA